MRNITLHLAALPLLVLCSLPPAIAQSADSLGRVTVSGEAVTPNPIRTDVGSSCRQVSHQLQDALGWAAGQSGAVGTTRVDFKLQAGRISDVRTSGGPRDMNRSIRRAVAALDCSGGHPQEQQFAFEIRFLAPDEQPSGAPAVALVSDGR